MRCENFSKAGKKGFENQECRLCGGKFGAHLELRGSAYRNKVGMAEGVGRWKIDRWGADLIRWLVETFKGEKVVELCKYMKAFTNLKRSGIRAGSINGG